MEKTSECSRFVLKYHLSDKSIRSNRYSNKKKEYERNHLMEKKIDFFFFYNGPNENTIITIKPVM